MYGIGSRVPSVSLTQLDWRDASEAGRLEAVVLVLQCREDTHSEEARRDADVDALLPEVRDLNHGHDFRALQDARRCELRNTASPEGAVLGRYLYAWCDQRRV